MHRENNTKKHTSKKHSSYGSVWKWNHKQSESFSTVSPKMLRKGFVAKAQTAHSTMWGGNRSYRGRWHNCSTLQAMIVVTFQEQLQMKLNNQPCIIIYTRRHVSVFQCASLGLNADSSLLWSKPTRCYSQGSAASHDIAKHNIHEEQILSLDLIMYSSIIEDFISISAQLAHTFPGGWSLFPPHSLPSLRFSQSCDVWEIQVLIS